jgi:hypothetical protein
MSERARRQFRRRRHGPAVLNPQPNLCRELREHYLEPIIPFQFRETPLAPFDGLIFGLLGRIDLEGYAAHFEIGIQWYTSQGPWLAAIAPPRSTDPLFIRGMPPGPWSCADRPKRKADAIARMDRFELRRKYEDIARRYLTGDFRGFHAPPPVTITAVATELGIGAGVQA